LIDMAEDLVGFPIRNDYDGFKHRIVGLPESYTYAVADNPAAMTGRRLLQRLGTEVMRKRDSDYWAKAWADKAKESIGKGLDVVAADVRFENEIMVMRDLAKETRSDLEIIFCDYRSDRYDSSSRHPSEELAQRLLNMGLSDGEVLDLTILGM
jgi:hypothetical protein